MVWHVVPRSLIRQLSWYIQNHYQPFRMPEDEKRKSNAGVGQKKKRSWPATWLNCGIFLNLKIFFLYQQVIDPKIFFLI